MQISGSSAYYAGLSTIQNGQNRVDQAAAQIANNSADRPSVGNQSTNLQAQQLLSVDRSQQDLAGSAVQLTQGKLEVEAGLKVEKAANETLGTLIDTYA